MTKQCFFTVSSNYNRYYIDYLGVLQLPAQKRRMNNTDRRVKRTKKALRDALFTLLEQKSINEITVTELTTLADVNRATFYFYYTDLIDMLQQIQADAYDAFKNTINQSNSSISTIEGFTEYSERLLSFCKEHETLFKFIVKNDINNQLYKLVQQLMLTNIPNSKDIFDENNLKAIKKLDVLSENFPCGIRLISTDRGLIPIFRPEKVEIKQFSQKNKKTWF